MIKFDDLYISEKLRSDRNLIINQIRHGKCFRPDVFIIYKNENTGRPELMQGFFFDQLYMQINSTYIYGITDSREDGVKYISRHLASQFDAVFDEDEEE